MNNMKINVINSDAKTYLNFVLLCTYGYLLLCTPTGEMNNMIREIFIYACILEYKIIVSGHMLLCFPTKLEA